MQIVKQYRFVAEIGRAIVPTRANTKLPTTKINWRPLSIAFCFLISAWILHPLWDIKSKSHLYFILDVSPIKLVRAVPPHIQGYHSPKKNADQITRC